jgi:hypothetical protein
MDEGVLEAVLDIGCRRLLVNELTGLKDAQQAI